MNQNFEIENSKSERKDIRKSYNRGALALLLFWALSNAIAFIFTNVYALVMQKKGVSPHEIKELFSTMSIPLLLMNLTLGVIAYPIAIKCGCLLQNIKVNCFFQKSVFNLNFILKGAVLILGAQALGSYLATIVTGIAKVFGISLMTIDTSLNSSPSYNILLFLLSCVTAPIFEELLFRGVILRAFSKVSINFGILASAFLFAIFHGNIPQAINAFAVGLVLAYFAVKTGSIIPCIILHFVANLNGMIQQIIINVNYLAAILYSNILMIGFLAASIIIVVLNKDKINIPKNSAYTKSKGLKIALTSWAFLIAIACYAFNIYKSISLK